MTDQSSDDMLVELGTASTETKGAVFGTGEAMGKFQPTGLSDR